MGAEASAVGLAVATAAGNPLARLERLRVEMRQAMTYALGLGMLFGSGCRPTRVPTAPVPPQPAEAAQAEAAAVTAPREDAAPSVAAFTDVAAVGRACQTLHEQSRAILAGPLRARFPHGRPQSVTAFADGLGVCHEGAGGAWALKVMDMDTYDVGGEDDPSLRMEGAVMLVHVQADGSILESDEAFLAQLNEIPDYGDDEMIRILAVHDYDGDGVDEVVVEIASSGYDLDTQKQSVLGVQTWDGAPFVGEPAMFEAIDYDGAVDHDGDGIYDLVSERKLWPGRECFGMSGGDIVGNPAVLHHARPDGSLSGRDAVAADFLREQCPKPPARLLSGGDYDWEMRSMRRIACARIWGQPADQVIARIAGEWATLSDEDVRGEFSCGIARDAFEDVARVEPPVTLSR